MFYGIFGSVGNVLFSIMLNTLGDITLVLWIFILGNDKMMDDIFFRFIMNMHDIFLFFFLLVIHVFIIGVVSLFPFDRYTVIHQCTCLYLIYFF